MQGVLFVDAGTATDTVAALAERTPEVGVGYGLRFHGALFGVEPSLIALDLAFPLPLSGGPAARPPVQVSLGFTQTF